MLKNVSISEAKRFILHKQGLLGKHKFTGKSGVLDFIRQAGCIQFDPIDVCGKNAELVLQSRVSGFSKQMLYELLYEDRMLLDNWNKNLSIIPVENWKYFRRDREWHLKNERSFEEIQSVCNKIKKHISEHGPQCSADLKMPEKVDWYWTKTKLSRAALEHLYFRGELAIHHKKGNLKYYDLIENCIPNNILNEAEPWPDDFDHKKWRVLERIGSVGLLWNRPSDAWLGIGDLKADTRNKIFDSLLDQGKIIPINVEGIKHTLYCRSEDERIFGLIRKKELAPAKNRCEFIAPLDNMMWDRNLIKAIWNFDYKWEIYTPQAERKFGYYVLPLLYGENFIGRIEPAFDKKTKKLEVKNLWYEEGIKRTKDIKEKVEAAVKKFEAFSKS